MPIKDSPRIQELRKNILAHGLDDPEYRDKVLDQWLPEYLTERFGLNQIILHDVAREDRLGVIFRELCLKAHIADPTMSYPYRTQFTNDFKRVMLNHGEKNPDVAGAIITAERNHGRSTARRDGQILPDTAYMSALYAAHTLADLARREITNKTGARKLTPRGSRTHGFTHYRKLEPLHFTAFDVLFNQGEILKGEPNKSDIKQSTIAPPATPASVTSSSLEAIDTPSFLAAASILSVNGKHDTATAVAERIPETELVSQRGDQTMTTETPIAQDKPFANAPERKILYTEWFNHHAQDLLAVLQRAYDYGVNRIDEETGRKVRSDRQGLTGLRNFIANMESHIKKQEVENKQLKPMILQSNIQSHLRDFDKTKWGERVREQIHELTDKELPLALHFNKENTITESYGRVMLQTLEQGIREMLDKEHEEVKRRNTTRGTNNKASASYSDSISNDSIPYDIAHMEQPISSHASEEFRSGFSGGAMVGPRGVVRADIPMTAGEPESEKEVTQPIDAAREFDVKQKKTILTLTKIEATRRNKHSGLDDLWEQKGAIRSDEIAEEHIQPRFSKSTDYEFTVTVKSPSGEDTTVRTRFDFKDDRDAAEFLDLAEGKLGGLAFSPGYGAQTALQAAREVYTELDLGVKASSRG